MNIIKKIRKLSVQFDKLNSKYQEIKEIAVKLKDLPGEEKITETVKAAYLWNEIKQDKVFYESIYEKNKDPRVREYFKFLDEIYYSYEKEKGIV